jgi:hypothetical protein
VSEFIDQLKQNAAEDIEMIRKKNSDYSANKDPFHNFTTVERAGLVDTETSIAVRMNDKMQRVMSLLTKNEREIEEETLYDTLSDLRNYANILQAYGQLRGLNKELNNNRD